MGFFLRTRRISERKKHQLMTMKGQAIFRGMKEVLLLLSVCTIACNAGYYWFTPLNQECTSNNIIDNENECKIATGQLNLDYGGTDTWNNYPKGCFKGHAYTFWNTHSYGSANIKAAAICKADGLSEPEWCKMVDCTNPSAIKSCKQTCAKEPEWCTMA